MIVENYSINYKYGDIIKIRPFFDVHWGNSYCDKNAFRRYMQEGDENTYYFGGGDTLDSIIVKDIGRYMKHTDDTLTDAVIDDQINSIIPDLLPYKERIIGLMRGNHEGAVLKHHGTDIIKRMCDSLECKYLGYSGLLRLTLHENGGRGRSVIIRYHHGWGGGSRTQGADITKYSKDAIHWDADIFLFGHVHKKQTDRIPRLGLAGNSLVHKPILLGICGTFLRTYSKTIDSTYSEEKGYPPVEIGGLIINVQPTREHLKMWIDL